MSSNNRKIAFVTLKISLMILVISLAFNFAFTPKTITTSSNNELTLSPEDYVNSLDNGGGGGGGGGALVNPNNPSGSGNDFDVIEYFEMTTSDEDIRLYNTTGTSPEIIIDAPSKNANLIYYNLTITDCYNEGGLDLTDDPFEEYSQAAELVMSDIEGVVYQFNVTGSIFGSVFIDSLSFPLATGPNGSNFTLVIMGGYDNGTDFIPDVTRQYFVQNFTAPPDFSWGEYIPFEGTENKLMLPEGTYFIGITLADEFQDGILWIASNDTFDVNSDDDFLTYRTSNHTHQPEPIWELRGVDLPFMYHYSDVAVTELWGMKVNDTIVYDKTGIPWVGNATWSGSIAPRSDYTFAFDITQAFIPDFIHMYIDYTLYCEFSDGTSYNTGSTYSVQSGQDVDWTMSYTFDVPYDFNGSLDIRNIPSDWTLTSVRAPDGSEEVSNVIYNPGNDISLTIPYNISQSGRWIFHFTSPNYVDSIFSQEKDSEGSYFNQTYFSSSDEMRVTASIENQMGPVGGGAATLTILKPESTDVAHTTGAGANSSGYVTFSDWEVPYNEPDGNYHLQVLWKNGTEVGFLDKTVKIYSESLDGEESPQESEPAKDYLTVHANYEGIIERGHSLDIQINVTRWGEVVEGLNITMNFLDETYNIIVYNNNETESSGQPAIQTTEVRNSQDNSYFDVTEDNGIYTAQINTVDLSPGNYTFEVYASKEGYEDTGSIFEFTVERMSVSTFFVAYTPKIIAINPLPSLSVFILTIGLIWLINMLLFSPVDADKFIDLYVYTNTGLGIDHVSFGSFETDEALMTGALAGISSLIAEATQTQTPPRVIEKEEFTIMIEYGEYIATSLFARVKAKSFTHRKISRDLKKLVQDFETENKTALERWTGDLSKIEPLSKYIISGFNVKSSLYIADLKYDYGYSNYKKDNLLDAFLLLSDAFEVYCKKKQIEKADQIFLLLQKILLKMDMNNYAPLKVIRPILSYLASEVATKSIKFALIRLVSKYLALFKYS